MPVDVVMPQMGESIAEGTVSRWLKKKGDKVERDEPILEISTDKVDAEIPSPAAGTLVELLAQEGDTVAVNSVVARIASEGEDASAPQAEEKAAAEEKPEKPEKKEEPAPQEEPAAPTPPAETEPASAEAEAPAPAPEEEEASSLEQRRRTRSSPLVRKIAKENDVDLSQIEGSGVSGRVTKDDILGYIERGAAGAQPSRPAASQEAPPAPEAAKAAPPKQPAASLFAKGENVHVEPLSVMRRKIADHMVISRRTSAHVTTVFEFDFTRIDALRRQYRETYTQRGVKLTYMPFIVQSVITALRDFPILNASMDNENIYYKRDVNIGIAVALDWGLIVPVLKNADEKNLFGLAKAINDLGERARGKKLNPDDVQGGTFTITNPGIYGGLFGTPIINQPQVAILGVGGVKKRPVVIESDAGDSIAIRSMCIMSLTFDHRLVDGAVADQFMARVREHIEEASFTM
jgi:pyruvate dehydrogenase E2 component (dihydrolipoamide acetyltransferase)